MRRASLAALLAAGLAFSLTTPLIGCGGPEVQDDDAAAAAKRDEEAQAAKAASKARAAEIARRADAASGSLDRTLAGTEPLESIAPPVPQPAVAPPAAVPADPPPTTPPAASGGAGGKNPGGPPADGAALPKMSASRPAWVGQKGGAGQYSESDFIVEQGLADASGNLAKDVAGAETAARANIAKRFLVKVEEVVNARREESLTKSKAGEKILYRHDISVDARSVTAMN
ncbi:MAG: hypothetical protein HY719_12680, partial [Planctomycetes bacterium]|nr:hypothetical protein [Planctomycetota bacterium]